MLELLEHEIETISGGLISGRGIYIGPDGAPCKDGMPIYIAIDQIDWDK